MTDHDTIIAYLDEELDVAHFNDADGSSFNGALVTGSGPVETVALCTNCTFETIAEADEADADLVISHHGGWERFDADHLAEKKQRIRDAGMTWYIAHEPLDCADGYGVSAVLAERLGVDVQDAFGVHAGGEVGRIGTIADADMFVQRLADIDDYTVVDGSGRHDGDLDVADGATVAVVGGGGGVLVDLLQEAADMGADVYVTGNSMFAGDIYAHEEGLKLVTLEETSSEKWGVHALGDHLAGEFDVDLHRIDETNW